MLPFSLSGLKSNNYNPRLGQAEPVVATKADHLCVLIHGLWGNPDHLWYLEQQLRAQYPKDKLYILTATKNAGSFTYDGIETGGERVTREIEETLQELSRQGSEVKKISLIGYSLGGLVARYAAGLLFSNGWFDKLEPVNFTTFASPHLGVRSPLMGAHSYVWNTVGARTLSMSGRQLFMIDSFRDTGRPLLSVLADSDSIFVRALSQFKHRSLYSNIINDRSAVYYTTGISRIDPFVRMNEVKLNYVPEYSPVILDSSNMVSRRDESEPVPAFRQRLIANTSFGLRKLPQYLFLVIFVPVGLILYVTNALVQSIRSAQRIRAHQAGEAGTDYAPYRVRLLLDEMRQTAEEVFEGVNSTQDQAYLPDSPASSTADGAKSVRPRHSRNGSLSGVLAEKTAIKDEEVPTSASEAEDTEPLLASVSSEGKINGTTKRTKPRHKRTISSVDDFPTLALTPLQFDMIDNLNAVGFKKYPVHIHSATHAHAAIIVRMDLETFKEGRVVVAHWLERFEL